MCLICPGDVGARDEHDGDAPMSRTRHELVNGPVFQHKARDEHDAAQEVVYDLRRDLAAARLGPEPLEHHHRNAVDRPQWEDASDWGRRGKFPGQMIGISVDFA